jgi:hypothetical protein
MAGGCSMFILLSPSHSKFDVGRSMFDVHPFFAHSFFSVRHQLNARLVLIASSICWMVSFVSVVNFGVISLFLSIVRICDKFTIESFFKPLAFLMATQIGYDAFLSEYSVITDTIVVGEYLLPISFCMTRIGRVLPVSLPMTGSVVRVIDVSAFNLQFRHEGTSL